MSVRLLLENGDVKKYITWRAHVEGENGPTTYRTECGMIWDTELPFDAGCKHIDCAIIIAKYYTKNSILSALILPLTIIVISILFLHPPPNDLTDMKLLFGGMCLLFFVSFTRSAYMNYKQVLELEEFRDHGTVNGIRAEQI